jgi:hypothetical protein
MVELLVALIVGAVMIHALLAAQKYSLYLATERDNTWKCLNVSQELFARLGLPDLTKRPTGTWIAIQGTDQGRWKSAYLARDQRSDIRRQQKQRDITSNITTGVDRSSYWITVYTDLADTILQWRIMTISQ